MCTLHSVAVETTFFIRAIVVGLPPGSASHSLTFVKISQFHFFRICCDLRILWTSRQQTLELLRVIIKKINNRSLKTVTDTLCEAHV